MKTKKNVYTILIQRKTDNFIAYLPHLPPTNTCDVVKQKPPRGFDRLPLSAPGRGTARQNNDTIIKDKTNKITIAVNLYPII